MGLGVELLQRLADRALRVPIPSTAQMNRNNLKPISRILVFGKFPNPTFDYYFAARLAAPGMPKCELLDIKEFDSTTSASGAFIIIVRYASFSVTRWIAANQAELAGVAVFLDDDIASAIMSPHATLKYRYRLLVQSVLPLRSIDRLIDELWVSTEALAKRLSYANPRRLGPAPKWETVPLTHLRSLPDDTSPVTIAYHATAIHVEEHHFLAPIIGSVLQARPNARFEVIADSRSELLWRKLASERITISRPLPWSQYHSSMKRQIDIMVVPVAPTRLNECRAETKRIDIVRMGAAALLSDCPAFRPSEPGELLLPYEPSIWINALLELVDQPRARQVSAVATQNRVARLAREANAGLPIIKSRAVTTSRPPH